MTNKQLDLLDFIYTKPRSVCEVYVALKLNYETMITLTIDKAMEPCFEFQLGDLYEDSLFYITNPGREFVEMRRSTKRLRNIEWVRYSVTTAIAVAAFIKTFFF